METEVFLKEEIKIINLFQKLKRKKSSNLKSKKIELAGGKTMKKVKMTVTGHVQGVGFRFMTKMVADQIGVFGSVRNQSDGSVYIEANGDPAKIEAFIDKIRQSPSPSGEVERLDITEDSSLPEKIKFSITN